MGTTSAAWDVTDVPSPCDVDGYDAELVAQAQTAAEHYLWALSGRRVGVFTTVGEQYIVPAGGGCGLPYKDASGFWRNRDFGEEFGRCCMIDLRRQPVNSISEVRLDGEVFAADNYALVGQKLQRIDGSCWPSIDVCDQPAIEVDYEWGIAPDDFAKSAMLSLRCEFLLGLSGDNCALPGRAVKVARQGVTVDMPSTVEFMKEGYTGIPLVDSYLTVVNPNRLRARSRVVSPDLPRAVR